MRTKFFPLAAIASALIVAGCGGGGASSPSVVPQPTLAPFSSSLVEPPVVASNNGVAYVSLTTTIDPATGLPAFEYNGQTGVAPTIRVHPGDTLEMDVTNDLPASAGMRSQMNIHFHGLTVSPNAPADDVLTMPAYPGNVLHYVVPIPVTQEPGLYFYHPHVMGETNLQMGLAGMSGAIIVDGLSQHLPALASMKQRLLIVRDVADGGAASAMSAARRTMDEDHNTNPCGPDPGVHLTVNGAVQPAIEIAPGESQLFRVVNATAHRHLDLAVDGASIQVVALDGYPIDADPANPASMPVNDILIPVADRAEFVVTASSSGATALRTLCYNAGSGGDPDGPEVLAQLRAPQGAPMHAAAVRLPHLFAEPLPHNEAGEALPAPAASRVVTFTEDSNAFYINGRAYRAGDPPMFTVHTGTVEAWTVVNDTEEVHDFHIHQVHFLTQRIDAAPVAHPYWLDTVTVPARRAGANGSFIPGTVTMLVDFRNPVIRGVFMFHCHILDHEDNGMMATIRAI